MKNTFLIPFISVLIFNCSSCIKKGGRCEEPERVENSEVVVTFKDPAGNYLYEEINPINNKDSLKVFDQDGSSLILLSKLNEIPSTTKRYYEISFGPIYKVSSDQISFTNKVTKAYIIQYKYAERDTIKVSFKSKAIRCGSQFESLEVYHKGQLLATVSNEVAAHITVIKP